MRKIVVTEFISLDGVIEDPGAQLLGRTTYEGFAKAWPDMEDGAGFAEKMNAMPKYVVSSTLTDPTWNNTTVISLEDVEQLEGKLLVAGSAQLVQGLMRRGLVDELRLMTFPVVLGSGKRLFGELDDLQALTLADVQTLGSGTQIPTYQKA